MCDDVMCIYVRIHTKSANFLKVGGPQKLASSKFTCLKNLCVYGIVCSFKILYTIP